MWCGWLWCKLQDVIKNEVEQCIGADLGKSSLPLGLIHCGLGANAMAVNWNRFHCYVCISF